MWFYDLRNLLESCFVTWKTRGLVCRFCPVIWCISATFYSLSDSSYVTTSSSRLNDTCVKINLPESDRLILFKSEASNTGIFADYDSPDVCFNSY